MQKEILSFTLVTSLTFVACGSGSTNSNNDDNLKTITHNNLTYKEIKSPNTNKIWLDRNLGATQVCTSIGDISCFGDLYQWGRQTDGHEKRTSSITNIKSNAILTAGDKFITTNNQWTDDATDTNGLLRKTSWSNTNGNFVCPSGFRIPTIEEIKAETFDISINTNTEVFESFLKLPTAGYRELNGTISNIAIQTAIWSNTINSYDSNQSHEAKYSSADENNSFSTFRGYGNSIRCIKN